MKAPYFIDSSIQKESSGVYLNFTALERSPLAKPAEDCNPLRTSFSSPVNVEKNTFAVLNRGMCEPQLL